jgi:WD40 repeat protein
MRKINNYWYNGPADDLPLTPQHDRTILSVDIKGDKAVTSSADHGLRVYSLKTGKCLRNLYNKKYGHTDWVTSCKFLEDQRILSAGMDNKLCLWDSRVLKCSDLQGHNSTISKIDVDARNVGISSSYDASLLVWNLDTLECAQGLFNGHREPVVEFAWRNSLVVSGDRGGSMAIWDINTGQCVTKLPGVHQGALSKIALFSDGQNNNVFLSTGLKDGGLAAHDMRTHKPIKKERVHNAAINMLETTSSGYVVTGSADKTLKTFDIFNSCAAQSTLKATDAIFCGAVLENIVVAGCGDGNILGFNLEDN